MNKYYAEDIVCDWVYRENKYTDEELHLVLEAIKYRVKHKQMNLWEPMFYYFANNQFNLSLMYAHKFYADAVKTHDKFGKSSADNWLGDHYLYGLGTNKDYKKAYMYYMDALNIDKNDLYALYDLAIMYLNGYYVKRDLDKYHEIITKLFNSDNCRNNDENDPYESMGPEIYQHYAYCLRDKGGKNNLKLAEKYLKKSREELVKFLYYNDWDDSYKQLVEVDENIEVLNEILLNADNSNKKTCISVGKKTTNRKLVKLIEDELSNYNKLSIEGDIYTLINLPKTNNEYTIKFVYDNVVYEIFAKKYKKSKMYYRFLEKNYRNMEELIRKGSIENVEIRQLVGKIKSINIII